MVTSHDDATPRSPAGYIRGESRRARQSRPCLAARNIRFVRINNPIVYAFPVLEATPSVMEYSAWTWSDQIYNKEEAPTITNKNGTVIYIAPRRYVVQYRKIHKDSPDISEEQIQQITRIVQREHDYRTAPEPLHSLDSIFQLLGRPSGPVIYASLTNISSQQIKRKLYQQITDILEENYQPWITWIQHMNDNERPSAYPTRDLPSLEKVLTTRQTDLETTRLQNPAIPWRYKEMVLYSHIATSRQSRVLPDRLRTLERRDENQQRKEKEKQAALKKIFINRARAAKRTRDQMSPSPSPERRSPRPRTPRDWEAESDDDLILLEVIEHLENGTHSSSTKRTKSPTGNSQQPSTSRHQASPPLITETTTTSSSREPQQATTSHAHEPELASTLERQLKDVQKLLPLRSKLDGLSDSCYIVSATVSKQQISMEVRLGQP